MCIRDSFVDVVMAAKGYPKSYTKNDVIEGIEEAEKTALVFHAGTQRIENGDILTYGGRVINVVGQGSSLQEAKTNAYQACL